jgi:formiminoglutamase
MANFQHDYYTPTPRNLYQGRSDSLPNERFFQSMTCLNLEKQLPEDEMVILGFGCDEGVKANLGRPGAQNGPDAFRQQFGHLANHRQVSISDAGNIICPTNKLDNAQQALGKTIAYLQMHKKKTMIIGGGHETAWGHFLGLKSHHKNLGILNFDAHFDLRPTTNGASSGTPFRQIALHQKSQGHPFHYACIGINPWANTSSLFKTANELNVPFLTQQAVHSQSFAQQTAFIDEFCQQVDALYLTLCLDVVDVAFAPGVSAPQINGLWPSQLIRLVQYVLKQQKLISFDIVELAPTYDNNGQTAKLAAMLAAEIIQLWH